MNLKEFLEKPDSLVLSEAAKCGTKEELKALLVSCGVTITDSETEKLYALQSKAKGKELSDEELDRVTGGKPGDLYYQITKCPRGHTRRDWKPGIKVRDIVDINCLQCEKVSYPHDDYDRKNPYCIRQGDEIWLESDFGPVIVYDPDDWPW